MDKIRLKSSLVKESNRNREPLLKPDVILIAKDVMVPLRLSAPRGKSVPATKPRVLKARSLGKPLFSSRIPSDQSLTQEGMKIRPASRGRVIALKSPPYCVPRSSSNGRTETLTSKGNESSSRLFDLNRTDSRSPPKSSKHSLTSVTTAEIHFSDSSKSFERIETSLPKFPSSIISSSESEGTVDLREYGPLITSDCNKDSKNLVDDVIRSCSRSNIDEQLTETSLNMEKLIDVEARRPCITSPSVNPEESKDYSSCDKNGEERRKEVQNIVDSIALEKERIMIDVECLMQSLLTNICKIQDLDNVDHCQSDNISTLDHSGSLNEEMEIFNYLESHSKERIPNRIGFRYSSEDSIDGVSELGHSDFSQSEKEFDPNGVTTDNEETVDNYFDVNANRSGGVIEAKYSWQIIPEKTKGIDDSDEGNSKETCTEDLRLNEPEFRYSWQELTAKYLPRSDTGDGSVENNQPSPDTKEIKEDTRIPEIKKNPENINKAKRSEGGENIARIVTNSPLNNIISSMLPEIKLIRRPNYLGSHIRPDYTKSPASYSSVSTIKHVLANLNDMVTTQKHVLDAHVRNHRLDPEPESNRFEKVEIFPATLHVLGDYIVRDINDMNDSRRLIGANNDGAILLTDNPGILKTNQRLDGPVGNAPPANEKHHTLHSDLFPPDPQDSSFPGNYSPIFTATDTRYPKEDDPEVTEQNWEPVIAEMEEMIELSADAAQQIEEDKDSGNEAVPHTKNTGPLKPRVQVSFTETREAGDSTTRRDELLSRLEGAMSRLKQSEQHVDANWNLDYSVLDVEDDGSEKEVTLPKQVEEHIKDIIKSAGEYLAKLEVQLDDLRSADDQIINSSERTFKDIDDAYQLFMDNLCQEINKRRNLVRLETEVFKYEGLAPLRACKQEVDAQIRSTQHLIVLTETMLTHPVTFNKERLGKIITATSHMGRIPAVPMPEELPYVTFSPPSEDLKKEISDRISCLGCVLRMGPAQFTEVCERPACLQLKWHVADPEFASEEQTFVVQKALGEIFEPTSTAFETVYVGQETSCFVRDIPVDRPITLRVGIQVTDTAWSVHRIAQTSIPAYNWDVDNSDYLITNSGRIATKVTQNLTTLLSRSPQFDTNYIIEFKFLEAASGSDAEGIGLVFEPGGADDDLKRLGALLITPNGNIFMNGDQKLMQLPKMELGTRIVFTSEEKDEDTLRMTIECGNKAVTYDWSVQRPLHFAARFSEPNKWNLMVK